MHTVNTDKHHCVKFTSSICFSLFSEELGACGDGFDGGGNVIKPPICTGKNIFDCQISLYCINNVVVIKLNVD